MAPLPRAPSEVSDTRVRWADRQAEAGWEPLKPLTTRCHLSADEIREAVAVARAKAQANGFTSVRTRQVERMYVQAANYKKGMAAKKAARAPQPALRLVPTSEVAHRRGRSQLDILRESVPEALAAAESLEAEMLALFQGAPLRTRELTLAYSGYSEWPAPTLEVLGAREGITRERVRQIVTKHIVSIRDLRAEGLVHTPYMDGAAEALTSLGGVASVEVWRSYLAQLGSITTDATLRALPALSETYARNDYEHRLVYSQALSRVCTSLRYETLHEQSGVVSDLVAELRAEGRRSLRRAGTVRLGRLARIAPDLPDRVIADLAIGQRARIVNGCVVPESLPDGVKLFKLGRAVQTMLAVTPDLTMLDIARGLARMGSRAIRLPMPVLSTVLAAWPDVLVQRGRVRPARPVDRADVLPRALNDIVDAIVEAGGRMSTARVKSVLLDRGHDVAWMFHIAYAPCFVRLAGTDMISLRGQHWGFGEEVTAAELSGDRTTAVVGTTPKTGRPSRRDWVLLPPSIDDSPATLRYRVTPKLLSGAIMLPKRMRVLTAQTQGTWHGVAADGGEWPLSIRHELLWDLAPWLRAIGAEPGGQILLAFEVSRRQIRMEYRGTN